LQNTLNAQVINGIPQQFQNIQGQLNNSLVARGMTGGQMAGSGGVAQGFGQLGAMEAGLQQQGLANVQIQKANLLNNALAAKMGIAGMYGQNTGLFNQGSLGALGQGVTAANNADQAQSGFWGSVIGGALGIPKMALP
jgi:hypothetical protein